MLAADLVGTFALVFAGCGAIMVAPILGASFAALADQLIRGEPTASGHPTAPAPAFESEPKRERSARERGRLRASIW